jgi:uncharacterized protein
MPFNETFLGTGWSFPPIFNRETAEVELTSGVPDIHKSLEILFTTSLGERVMNPTYGCSLEEVLFDTLDTSRLAYIENLLKTAILYHEARIDAQKIELRPEMPEGVLWIQISYTVRATNARFNFVYPYYLARGGA